MRNSFQELSYFGLVRVGLSIVAAAPRPSLRGTVTPTTSLSRLNLTFLGNVHAGVALTLTSRLGHLTWP